MTTIPARDIVSINPGVLPAGGSALDMIGLLLTSSTRVPIGTIQPFASGDDVGDYFGENSQEKELADIYFLGFDNSHKKPGSVLFAQYNQGAVAAYIRSGAVASLSLAQLQSISGTLAITVDGYPRSAAALNLSSATSFSAAAALIQTALNAGAANPSVASVTGSIGPQTSSFNGSIAGNLLTVNTISTGTLYPGTTVTGSGVTAATKITGQISGTTGGVGLYTVNNNQVIAAEAMTGAYGLLTVTAVSSGTLALGLTVTGTGGGVITATKITALGTGTGGTGTYIVDVSQTKTLAAGVSAAGSDVTVSYDSTFGSFIITSGVYTGGESTMAFATGTTSTSLKLTSATGALLSQGLDGQTPGAFMDDVIDVTQNWATFMTLFDPDYETGSTQKQLFAEWVNSENNQFAYVGFDTDITATTIVPASSSLGQILNDSNSSGTFLHWSEDVDEGAKKAAFVCGTAASIDFTQRNGRITFAFRSQTGLLADVVNQSVAHNLGGDPQSIGSRGNYYNFYGAYATRNDQFVWENRGFVSGPFLWFDSYINQIWLNNALQLALMVLLQSSYSIPYNTAGYALIEAACLDPISDALNFGAIRAGITLSQSQRAQVNNNAGIDIADTIEQRGWYLQILDASPQVRVARASPPMTLWYTDGQSVQAINLASIEIQ